MVLLHIITVEGFHPISQNGLEGPDYGTAYLKRRAKLRESFEARKPVESKLSIQATMNIQGNKVM